MAILIKKVKGIHLVEFDKGVFDEWCVFLTKHNKPRYAPKDVEYFKALKQLAYQYSNKRIYDDFLQFYFPATNKIDTRITEMITRISENYKNDQEEIDIWFTVIYAGMVAEENKENTVLRKRIKRLGMHQLLIENKDAEFAANFSKGKKWKELDEIMTGKGF